MKIKFFAENKKKSQIIFECVENTNSAHQGKEFIVINLNTDNEEMNFKHGLVADYLHHLVEHDCITDWKYLDANIAEIMNSKVHFI